MKQPLDRNIQTGIFTLGACVNVMFVNFHVIFHSTYFLQSNKKLSNRLTVLRNIKMNICFERSKKCVNRIEKTAGELAFLYLKWIKYICLRENTVPTYMV